MRWTYLHLVGVALAVAGLNSSCANNAAESELKVSVSPNEVNTLPANAYSCADFEAEDPMPSIAPNYFKFNRIRLEWQNKKDQLFLTLIRIKGKSDALEGEINCVIEGYELAYMIKGQNPDTAGLEITLNPGSINDLPTTGARCVPTCGGIQFKKDAPLKAVSLTIEVFAVQDGANPKPVRTETNAVLMPFL
jgi:hypothetical protein